MSGTHTLSEEKKKSKKPNEEYCLIPIRKFGVLKDEELVSITKKFTSIKDVVAELENDCYYNYQLKQDVPYKIFGDLDYLPKEIKVWTALKKIIKIMNKIIDGNIEKSDVSLTKNDDYIDGMASYHYVIKKYNATVKSQKELFEKIIKELPKKYTINDDHEIIDTSNYCKHKLRLPNQSKGASKQTHKSGIHRLKNGSLKDFILDYIPKDSINIDDKFVTIHPKKDKRKYEDHNEISPRMKLISSLFNNTKIFKLLFDNCYKKERFDDYSVWINVGMALHNELNVDECFEVFKYFSQKGSPQKIANDKEIHSKIQSFKTNSDKKLTAATIHWYAKEDNREEYKKVIAMHNINLTETDIVKYVEIIKPSDFIWVNKKHYAYNGKYYEQDDTCGKFGNFIGGELYSILCEIIGIYYFNSPAMKDMTKFLKKLKTFNFQKNCNGLGEKLLRKDIEFDSNVDILPFNNLVYDLHTCEFREFKHDDYVSMTTGYDWSEPNVEDTNFLEGIINQILPKTDIKDYVLTYLSTGMNMRQLQYVVFFTGFGGNAKSFLSGLMREALGKNFVYKLDNTALTSKKKAGADPNFANLHKKRFVFVQEPDDDESIRNSIIKDITGSSIFNARNCYSNENEITLCITLVVECNGLPSLVGSVTGGDMRRIKVIPFESEFTHDISRVNHEKHIYLANDDYMLHEFRERYKFAFLHILMKYYKLHVENKGIFVEPTIVKNTTFEYLVSNDDIQEYLEPFIEKTKNKEDILKITDMYTLCPERFRNKCTLRSFIDKVSKNPFYKDNYLPSDRSQHLLARLFCYKKRELNDNNF